MSQLPKMDKDEFRAFKTLELYGPLNVLSVYGAGVSPDGVSRLLSRGILEPHGVSGVRLVPPDKLQRIAEAEAAPPVAQGPEVASPASTVRPDRRPQSRKLGTDKRKGIAERVVELLTHEGPKMRYRELRRRLSSNRYPEWKEAIEWLAEQEAVSLVDGWIELTDQQAAERLGLAPPYAVEKSVKRKRTGTPSERHSKQENVGEVDSRLDSKPYRRAGRICSS